MDIKCTIVLSPTETYAVQKMNISIKDFLSENDQIRNFLSRLNYHCVIYQFFTVINQRKQRSVIRKKYRIYFKNCQ